ncbi:MAG: DUF3566 domain-containing protein [Ilumatobacteraceae bacterium]
MDNGRSASGNGHGASGAHGADNGNGHETSMHAPPATSPGQRLRRRLAASSLLRPAREPVLDAPDAEPRTVGEVPRGPSGNGGPVLLPPIRTGEAPTAGIVPGEPAAPPASPSTSTRSLPAAPTVKPVAVPATSAGAGASVVAPSRLMPFIRPPAQPEVVPGELVAQKVVAPLEAASFEVAVDPEPTGQFALPRVGRPSITFQRRRTRPRVRRVTRVVRHIDTWSVFKVALVFSAFLYAVTLTAGVLLWHVAIATGTVDNVERFFEGFGWQTFKFKGGEIYHNAWIAGMFVAIGLTGFAVLVATMFNLITDLVGGIRVSVLEEEVLARRDRTAKVVVEDDPDVALPYDQARSG